MTDKLYKCKFVADTTRRRDGRTGSASSDGESKFDEESSGVNQTTTEEDRRRRRMSNNMPGRPRGKVECNTSWDQPKVKTSISLGSLHLENSIDATPSAPPLSSSTTTARATATATATPKILLVGMKERDMVSASREMKNKFRSRYADQSILISQQNQHQLIVLSAAGNNIVLDELQPVTLGTKTVVNGVPIGDELICIGHATSNKENGSLEIVRTNDITTSTDQPFILSRKSKHQVCNDLRDQASSFDTASMILGISAGGLLAASAGIGLSSMTAK
jgi:hypothetical protein